MSKNKRNNKINSDPYDPYEDSLRLDKLDPYEGLIKLNALLKQKNENLK